MSDATVTTEPPQANDPAARTSDGTLRDQSPNTTPSQNDPKDPPTEGGSFLTDPAKKPEAEVKLQIKPEGETKPEDKKPDAPAGAPEKYEDFKLPDGFKLDAKLAPTIQATFKELGLTQEGAQKLIDLYAANGLEASQAPYKAWADLQKEWTSEIANRFPGDKATTVKATINSVIESTLPPSLAKNFRDALNITGAGSNPDIVEALSIMLKPLSEGTPVKGGGPSKEGQTAPGSGPPSIADAMYGHLRK